MNTASLAALATALFACAPDPHTPAGAPRVALAAPEVATVEGVIDALPACVPLATDGRVDVAAGCADDGCVGMTAVELEQAWGSATCSRQSSAPTSLRCVWPSGVWARFDDHDDDGVPDDGSSARPLLLEPPYDGATADGLGVGASLSCFVDALGYPDAVRLSNVDDTGWRFRSMAWSSDGVELFDLHGEARASVVALSGAE